MGTASGHLKKKIELECNYSMMLIVAILQDRCRHGTMGIELELGVILQQF